jgi:hypothetical protein
VTVSVQLQASFTRDESMHPTNKTAVAIDTTMRVVNRESGCGTLLYGELGGAV